VCVCVCVCVRACARAHVFSHVKNVRPASLKESSSCLAVAIVRMD